MDGSNLSILPRETKNIIASFLDDRSRRMMRLTSTHWFDIINYDEFTIYFARPATLPDIIQTFSRCSKPIGCSFAKTIGLDSTFTTLASLHNLTKLIFLPDRMEASYMYRNISAEPFAALTNLQHFKFNIDFLPHLQNFTSLTRLVIPTDAKLNLTYLDQLLYLTRLKDFALTVPFSAQGQINVISKLGNPSALKRISIQDNAGVVFFDEESVARMSNVSKVSIWCHDVMFPFSKLPNLASLDISSGIGFDDLSTCTKLTFLRIQVRGTKREPPVGLAMNQDYQQLTALTNLRTLNIHSNLKEDQFSFLSSLPNLEMLLVYSPEKADCGLTGQSLKWIKSTKLKTIRVKALNDIEYISHLTSLQQVGAEMIADMNPDCSVELRNVTSLLTKDIRSANVFPNLRQLIVHGSYSPQLMAFDRLSKVVLLTQLESLSLPKIGSKMLQLIGIHTQLTRLLASFDLKEEYDFDLVGRLTNLKSLSFRSDRLKKTMNSEILWQSISKLTNLEEMDMFDITEDSVASLEQLPKLTRLSVTDASANNFNKTLLSNLTNLQLLQFSSPIVDPSIQDNKSILNLPYLYSNN